MLWIALWLVLSMTLLFFFGWTLLILQRQKRAWSLFARKRKLKYTSGGLADAPEMEGEIEGYEFSFFPGQYDAGDVRQNRKFTAIEVSLRSELPFEGFVASGMLVEVAKGSGLPQIDAPTHSKWKKEWVVLSDNPPAMRRYLSEQRLDVIVKWLMKQNLWFVLGFRNGVFLLRIDTPLPLDDAKKLNAIVKTMLRDIAILEVDEAEISMLRLSKDSEAAIQPKVPEMPIENTQELQLDDESAS